MSNLHLDHRFVDGAIPSISYRFSVLLMPAQVVFPQHRSQYIQFRYKINTETDPQPISKGGVARSSAPGL